MSYQFEHDETPGAAIRRVATEELEGALVVLAWQDTDAAVHDLRKRFKRLRALLRLCRDGLDKKARRSRNAAYRDTARLLSDARDSRVLVDTAELTRLDRLLPALQERHAWHMTVFAHEGVLANLTAPLETFLADARTWPVTTTAWSDLHPGLVEIFRRSATAHVMATTDPTPGNLHQWRKRVKDLWYANTLLLQGWPEITGPFNATLDVLAGHLGIDHDLALLATVLRAEGLGDGEAQATIAAHRSDLQGACWPLARRIYAEAPAAYATRTLSYWRRGSLRG